jgi:glycosyltransferase involved in cell wall biosynthesis
MRATIIIPTYNHARYVASAIACALRQTVPVEVIVVDDGSTDETPQLLQRLLNADDGRLRVLSGPHAGVAVARNDGIEAARGDFVMFLDADDEIAPTKIERQIAVLDGDPGLGWTFCDTRIVEVSGREELASERYGYAEMLLDGSIMDLLRPRNFIPIHAPLIRRSALGAIRFPTGETEDWSFLRSLAAVAQTRYTGDVLATYRKRPRGRNATQQERRVA